MKAAGLTRGANAAIEALTLTGIVLGALCLGGVTGWGLALLFAFLAAAFLLWLLLRIWAPEAEDGCENDGLLAHRAPALTLHSPWMPRLLLLLGLYLVAQTLPLPRPVVAMLSPLAVALEKEYRGALDEPLPGWLPLTVDAASTREALVLFVLAAMALTLGAYLAGDPPRARRITACLMGLALFQALYGLGENLTGHHHVFWIAFNGTDARGTFFNRNHFAALLALFTPVSLGWFYARATPEEDYRGDISMARPSWWEVFLTPHGLLLFIPATLVLGIIQSASRGGFVAMLAGCGLFFALGAHRRSARVSSWLAFLLGLTIAIFALNGDHDSILNRFGEIAAGKEDRTFIWKSCPVMIRDFPVFGVGLGNFGQIFMRYATFNTIYYPYVAHSEWIEGAVTLGLAGMTLVAAATLVFFVQALQQVRRARRDQPWLLGLWCGLAGLAIHCLSEFNLHIPSLTVITFLLCGLLLGYPTPRRSAAEPPGRQEEREEDATDEVDDEGAAWGANRIRALDQPSSMKD